jgi:hypothetical protein
MRGAKAHLTPERTIERAQKVADDRVHHLLVKMRIRITRLEATIAQDVGMIEIERWMEAPPIVAFVDDGDPAADRAGLKPFKRHAQNEVIAAAPAKQGVERVDPEGAVCRLVFTEWILPTERIALLARHHVISTW